MAKTKKNADRTYTWRDEQGRSHNTPIAKPAVGPKSFSVGELRQAVRSASSGRFTQVGEARARKK